MAECGVELFELPSCEGADAGRSVDDGKGVRAAHHEAVGGAAGEIADVVVGDLDVLRERFAAHTERSVGERWAEHHVDECREHVGKLRREGVEAVAAVMGRGFAFHPGAVEVERLGELRAVERAAALALQYGGEGGYGRRRGFGDAAFGEHGQVDDRCGFVDESVERDA